MMMIGSNSLINKGKPSLMNGALPRKATPEMTNRHPIGRKNCKMKGLELSNPSCPNSRNPLLTAFLRSPSRILPQDFPHPSWEVVILKPETRAVGRNDYQLMQCIPRPDLSTQILVMALCHSPTRGRYPPTNLIPMLTHVALETTLQSLNTPLGVLMSTPVMNPSSPSQMWQSCPAPPHGMIQSLGKPVFWL